MKYTSMQLNSFFNTPHAGVIMGADIGFKTVSQETGDAVKIFLVVEDGIIKDAKFQACGSVVLYASLSAIMELIINKTIEEAQTINEKLVIREIKQVNRCDYATVSFAIKSLINTINAYFKKLNRLAGKVVEKKPAKSRSLVPASSVSIFTEKVEEQEEDINPYEDMLNTSIDEEVKVQEPEPKNVQTTESDTEEEVLTPISLSPTKTEVIDSVPTKIEVRVLEEEQVEQKETKTKKESARMSAKISEKIEVEDKNDDVIDEIDSITAKLTDAITKLNFKFDIDE